MLRVAMPGAPSPMPQPEDPANAPDLGEDRDQGGDSDTQMDNDEMGLPKLDPTLAGYLPPEKGPFTCSNCVYFEAEGSCHIVSGDIKGAGCCNLYTSKASSPQAGAPSDDSQPQPLEEQDDVQPA
jgi:hypothetical protein